ncbi:MAG: hypothetical protein EPN93_12940 [Spirochaetes bacterium]|nr:MAG: hypothetical protein EPN93_12940 [Spirochaetota bacterium]
MMKRYLLLLPVLIIACGMPGLGQGCSQGGGVAQKRVPCRADLHETALFLAGMPAESGDEAWIRLREDPVYAGHVAYMDRFWENVTRLTVVPVRAWRPGNLPAAYDREMVFYPLSGADFINMYCLFPDAPFYLMVALEPPGDAPALAAMGRQGIASLLYSMQTAIPEFGMMNYFMSHIMQNAMTGTQLAGVAPVIMAFMARLGLRVCGVERIGFDDEGRPVATGTVESAPAQKNNAPAASGVRISFNVPGETEHRTLVYLCAKLDDGFARGGSPEGRYVGSFRSYVTMLKSAIFFMHYDWIGAVRAMVLDRSLMIVQDDSGIPYRFFDRTVWDVRLLGIYDPSYTLTNATVLPQPDMRAAYPRDNAPLPFHYGYGVIINKSNMQIAVKKKTTR